MVISDAGYRSRPKLRRLSRASLVDAALDGMRKRYGTGAFALGGHGGGGALVAEILSPARRPPRYRDPVRGFAPFWKRAASRATSGWSVEALKAGEAFAADLNSKRKLL